MRTAERSPPRELLAPTPARRLLALAALDWTAVVVLGVVLSVTPGWTLPLWILLLAGRLHSLGVLAHEVVHQPRRGGRRLLEALTALPVLTTLPAMRYHHLRHHRYTNTDKDPYFRAPAPGRRPLGRAARVALGLGMAPYLLVRPFLGCAARGRPSLRATYARWFLLDRSTGPLADSKEVISCLRAEPAQLLFLGVVGVLAAWRPEDVLLIYVLPLLLAGALATWRLTAEHNGTIAEDKSLASLLATTNDHGLGLLGRVVTAPGNIGCHVVHHLHPQSGMDRLPALRAWYGLPLLLCAIQVGCAPPEPAPEDLDSLLHFVWAQYDDGEDEQLADAVRNLHALLDDGVVGGGESGSVSLLDDEERALIGNVVDGIEPESEAGLYTADSMDSCSLAELEEIMAFLEQDLLFDHFDSYARSYTSDRAAYFDRTASRLTWDVAYSVTIPFAGRYDAETLGEARRVDDLGAASTPFGPFVIFRSALAAPATFDSDGNVFDQDRRIQLLYTPADGRLTHIEALWRHMEAGAVDTGSEVIRSLIVSGLHDWEDEAAAWCGEDLP